jgi:hypothetical protein
VSGGSADTAVIADNGWRLQAAVESCSRPHILFPAFPRDLSAIALATEDHGVPCVRAFSAFEAKIARYFSNHPR